MLSKRPIFQIFLFSVLIFSSLPIIPQNLGNVTSGTKSAAYTPESSGLLDILWTDDGEWFQDNSYSRFRGYETPMDETFYQWWYWAVKDLESDIYFAFCYYYIRAPSDPSVEGFYMLFSAVTNEGNVMIWYKYDLNQFHYWGNDFQISAGNNNEFNQIPITNDLYHISGLMNNPAQVWTSEITKQGLTETSVFSWNLDISRIVGACTQNDFIDDPLMENGIKWNTHSFDGLASGSVQMGDQIYTFDGDTSERSYFDTNFDKVFLGQAEPDEPEDKYRWSWASATKYDPTDATNDISIIAGYGVSDNMFGLTIPATGAFAAAYNVIDHNIVWKSIDTREGDIDVNLVEKCSWGSSKDTVVEVSIDAWDYFIYTDSYGSARIPKYQRYILEGEYVSIQMTFIVEPGDINRLPSAYTEYTWSNFEALGCTAFVQIYHKTYKWWDVFHLNPINVLWDQFWDYSAGLEYGYAVLGVEI